MRGDRELFDARGANVVGGERVRACGENVDACLWRRNEASRDKRSFALFGKARAAASRKVVVGCRSLHCLHIYINTCICTWLAVVNATRRTQTCRRTTEAPISSGLLRYSISVNINRTFTHACSACLPDVKLCPEVYIIGCHPQTCGNFTPLWWTSSLDFDGA